MKGLNQVELVVPADREPAGEEAPPGLEGGLAWVNNPEIAPPEVQLRLAYRALMRALKAELAHSLRAAAEANPNLLTVRGFRLDDPSQVVWVVDPSVLGQYGGLKDMVLKMIPLDDPLYQVEEGQGAPPKKRSKEPGRTVPIHPYGPYEALFHWVQGRHFVVDLRAVRPLPFPAEVYERIRDMMRKEGRIGGLPIATSSRQALPPPQIDRVSPLNPILYPEESSEVPLSIEFDPTFGPVVRGAPVAKRGSSR